MSGLNEPVSFKDRVHEIDGIRGFALLGILMMNIMSFASPMMQYSIEGRENTLFTSTAADEGVIMFINTFVTANFYTMFSFLFGLGFYIFLTRANEKGHHANRLFIRRIILLLLFGLMHGILLWYGDILWTYAVAGIFLLLFYKLSPKTNLITGIVILSAGTVFTLLIAGLGSMMGDIEGTSSFRLWFDMQETILNGSYIDVIIMNSSIMTLMLFQAFVTVPNVLAMFLIGLYAAQKGIFQNLDAHRTLINRTAVIGLSVGLPVKILSGYGLTYGGMDPFWSSIGILANTLGGPLMALSYIALFIIIARKTKVFVKLLQPVGQMALTNYISQTVIMLIIFYGFNFFNQVSPVWFIPIVISVFIFQIGFSHIWMRIFRYGPLEWLWRSFTYLKLMPIKR
ncbi:DUF418 domain-containing protein [Corticicoccus populi]|uniref:DUF418 domain-containing protein n=1 Tax=Corticicoccus populi TaxID=1812821 RepID=A0ABW5WSZ9_9STAP